MTRFFFSIFVLILPLFADVDIVTGRYLETTEENNEIFYEYEGDQIAKRFTTSGHILENRIEGGKVVEQWSNQTSGAPPELVKKYTYTSAWTEIATPRGLAKRYWIEKGEVNRVETLFHGVKQGETKRTQEGDKTIWVECDGEGTPFRTRSLTVDETERLIEEALEGKGIDLFTTSYTYEGENVAAIETDFRRETFEYDGNNVLILHQVEELESGKVTCTWTLPDEKGRPYFIEEKCEKSEITRLLTYNEENLVVQEEVFDKKLDCRKVRIYDYDERGRLCFVSSEIGEIAIHYPDPCTVVETNFTTGDITETSLNFLGKILKRVVKRVDGTTLVQRQSFDGEGNLLSSTDVLGNKTVYEYDPAGRLAKKIDPAVLDEEGNEIHPTTHYFHNAFGHLVQVIDAVGGLYQIEYNALGQPTEVIDPAGHVKTTTFRRDGEVVAVESSSGIIREKTSPNTVDISSTEGILIEHLEIEKGMIRCGQGTLKAEFDDLGVLQEVGNAQESQPVSPPSSSNIIAPEYDFSHTNDRGQRTLRVLTPNENRGYSEVLYDALGRVEEINEYGESGELGAHEEYRYDPLGRRTYRKSGERITHWTYHPSGKIASESEEGKTTSYEYTAAGALESVVKPDGAALYYTYTPKGELQGVTSSDGTIDYFYEYEDGNLVLTVDRIQGVQVARRYDSSGNLVEETQSSGYTVGAAYDPEGKRNAFFFPDGSSVQSQYEAGKLIALERMNREGKLLYTHQYLKYSPEGYVERSKMIGDLGTTETLRGLDGVIQSISSPYHSQELVVEGLQITSSILNGEETRYSYGPSGELLEEGNPVDFTSDTNGRMVQEGENFYTYDPLDRLVKVSSGKTEIHYRYDPLGRCYAKQEGEKTSYFLYDGENEIGEIVNGSLQSLRILGIGHGAEIGAAVALEIKGKTYAPCYDHRGSIISLVDLQTKKVVESYSYEAFGAATLTKGKGINPWRFMSKRFEEAGNLYLFGKRCYSPKLKQWTTKDPLGSFDGADPYAFVHNNPIGNIDLYGLFSISAFFESTLLEPTKSVLNYLLSFQEWIPSPTIVSDYIDGVAREMLGMNFLQFCGFCSTRSYIGTYGTGKEPGPLERVTFINGILTSEEDIQWNLHLISSTHGGCDVHYCYVGTRGWSNDMARAALVWFFHVLSPEAEQLIHLWRTLIEEMGGVSGGGKITHYAHSLGASDTYIATRFLSAEEKKMLSIITFGSPTFIQPEEFFHVVNLVHRGDGVPWLNGIHYLFSQWTNPDYIKFHGSRIEGWLICNHLFSDYFEEFIFNFIELTN